MDKWGWLIIVVFVVLLGCTGLQRPVESEIGETLTTEKAKKEAVITITEMRERLNQARATDIYRGIFIVAFAVGVFAFFRGSVKVGLATMGGSIGGLFAVHIDQKIAEIPWQYIGGAALIVVGFICFMYRDRIGKAAFKNYIGHNGLSKAEEKLVNKIKRKEQK